MTSSFRYPSQLLHSYTEPQWLPPTHDQQSSSLDRLEAEEAYQLSRLKALVLPDNIPEPIGMDDSKKFALNAQQSAAASTDAEASLFGPNTSTLAQRPSFWEKHQGEILGTSSTLEQEEDRKAASLRKSFPGSAYRDRSLPHTPITMSSYKRSTRNSNSSLKRTAGPPATSRHAPSPRTDASQLFGSIGAASSSDRFDFGTGASTAASATGSSSFLAGDVNTSNNSSMMSLSQSHDNEEEGDTTFDRTYDEDDDDDDEMEED